LPANFCGSAGWPVLVDVKDGFELRLGMLHFSLQIDLGLIQIKLELVDFEVRKKKEKKKRKQNLGCIDTDTNPIVLELEHEVVEAGANRRDGVESKEASVGIILVEKGVGGAETMGGNIAGKSGGEVFSTSQRGIPGPKDVLSNQQWEVIRACPRRS